MMVALAVLEREPPQQIATLGVAKALALHLIPEVTMTVVGVELTVFLAKTPSIIMPR